MTDAADCCIKNVLELEATRSLPLGNFKYSKLVRKNNRKDESDIYGCFDSNNQFPSTPINLPKHVQTSFDVLCDCAHKYGDEKHMGVRKKTVHADGSVTFGEYIWNTYSDTVKTVKTIGTAIRSENLISKSVIDECDIVNEIYVLGLWAVNCPYWLQTDYAAMAYGYVTVPIYESLGDDALLKIIDVTKMHTMCIDSKKIPTIKRLFNKMRYLSTLILFDKMTVEDEELLKDLGLRFVYIDDLVQKYKHNYVEPPKRTSDDVCTIIFTSGTAGMPKGAVYNNRGMLILIERLLSVENRILIRRRCTVLSYLPLSHVYERFVEHFCTTFLCRIGYYSGNIKQILDDIKALKPDIFIGVPRVFTKMLQKIRSGVESKPPLLRRLVNLCVEKKKLKFASTPESPSHLFCDLILKKIKNEFGGNLDIFVLGSAAMTQSDLVDLQSYLSCPVSEGWGATEVGILFLQDYRDTVKGTIGGPLYGVEFKLRSIEELEYDARGNPPRGELVVKAPGFMLGYLSDPKLTAEVLDKEGWYRTGDVVELLDNMGVKILDRARNIFKLSQGEYIAPDKLENAYINSPLVEQLYVHGQSTESHIVGIVVVSSEEVLKWAANNGLDGKSVYELLNNDKLKCEIAKHFDKIADAQNFNSLEKLRHFTLVDQMFTTENGLMTPTFKSVRHKIKALYEAEIKAMYDANK